MTKTTLYRSILISGTLVVLSGCANVEPYERSFLAEPHMAVEPNPLHAAYMEHLYFSREGISGGYGGPASGCGCN